MNTKDTVILLIFLLSVLGLILGVYYTEDTAHTISHQHKFERVYEDNDSIITITLEKKEENDLSNFLT